MKMTYKNDFGTVDMFGEGGEGFCICDIDGLELLGKERSLVRFYNTDGYQESSSFFGQRVITVSGDIKTNDYENIENAIRILSKPGTLRIDTKRCSREITVNDVTFKTERRNGMYKTFCVQMTCDNPHFTDCNDITKGVYYRNNLITDETVLPAMFTERSFGGIIENTGDVECEPKIIVECLENSSEDGSLIIENKTAGTKIVINYKVKKDEVITVDIPNRVITSNVEGDITNCLDPESYLCDIYLLCGGNEFDVTATAGNRNCDVYLVYRNKYTGMVV